MEYANRFGAPSWEKLWHVADSAGIRPPWRPAGKARDLRRVPKGLVAPGGLVDPPRERNSCESVGFAVQAI